MKIRKGSKWERGPERPIFGLAAFVVRRLTAPFRDAPSSRLAASPNLWPRHPRLFMRWLLVSPSRMREARDRTEGGL